MVLLVGGDTYDYKGYLGDSISYIPTLYHPVDGGFAVVTHAPVDALFGDVDGDYVPDIPIGRLPLREPTELAIVVNKIIAYDERDKSPSSVFAADAGDIGGGYSFDSTAQELVDAFPAAWKAANTNIFVDDYGLQGAERYGLANSDLTNTINGGLALASYFGHSGPSRWSTSTPALLDTNDVTLLLNDGAPPLVAQWGCWNTYYVLPNGNTMGHMLLLDGAHGAGCVNADNRDY
jgi:hypothetical protein